MLSSLFLLLFLSTYLPLPLPKFSLLFTYLLPFLLLFLFSLFSSLFSPSYITLCHVSSCRSGTISLVELQEYVAKVIYHHILSCAMLCYVVPCDVMLCYTMLCNCHQNISIIDPLFNLRTCQMILIDQYACDVCVCVCGAGEYRERPCCHESAGELSERCSH